MENYSEIYILDTHQDSREILKSYLESFDSECNIKIFGDYEYAVEEIKKSESTPIVFIDISEKDNIINSKIEDIKLITPKIVITSKDYSTNTIIKAMRLGAKEFLPKPIIKEDLQRTIALLFQHENNNESASKIITLLPCLRNCKARLMDTLDFPTPPFPLVTVIILALLVLT